LPQPVFAVYIFSAYRTYHRALERLYHMSDTPSLREKLTERLKASEAKMPTSSIGRLSKTALTGARTGKLLLGKKLAGTFKKAASGEDIDVEALCRIITSIGELKGLVMKMGQIMSYIDVALPKELSDALSVLQTQSQPMPIERVRETIQNDLGDKADTLLETLNPEPIAAASIGQVHRSVIDGQGVAVKIQYPDISKTITADFAPSSMITKVVNTIFPHLRIADFVVEMRTRLLEECDYLHEAKAQQTFGELFKDHHRLVVPNIYSEFCSEHVLTSAFINGISFEKFLATDPSQELRNDIGVSLFQFYIGTLFRHRLYNCDPHPGNYLFMEDNRVAMLDYGCTREFEDGFVHQLANFTAAVHRDDPQELYQACLDIGIFKPDRNYDFDTVRNLIRGFYGPMLEDKEQAIELGSMSLKEVVDNKMELNKLSLPAEFLFLLRIRFGLMSVLAQLGAVANWRQLEARCIAALRAVP